MAKIGAGRYPERSQAVHGAGNAIYDNQRHPPAVFIIHDALSFPKDLQRRKGKPQKCIDTDRLRHFSMAWLLLVHEYADRPSLSVVQAP